MRRNISNELIVALLAALSLLFAAVFAVLLSTSTSQRPPSQPTVATVEGQTSTLTAESVRLADATETPIPVDHTRIPVESATPMPQPIAVTGTAPAVVATRDLSLSRTPTIGAATQLPLATQPSADQTEIAFIAATTTLDAAASATPSLTDVSPTATLQEAATGIAPANLTLTAIRETVAALAERSTARTEATAKSRPVDATETPLATDTLLADATETATPQLTEVPPTATLEEAATLIAPANLTLTAIGETTVALAERSTARAEATAELTPVDATDAPLATETAAAEATETATPQLTEVLPTATPKKVVTGLAPANLTLTAIRETVAALAERSTARMELTPELTIVDATETPLATDTLLADATETPVPSPTDVVATATPEKVVTGIAPANLTLTAIRETVVALAERSTARVEVTPELTAVDATDAPLATETVTAVATETATPQLTEVPPTATLEEAATLIAPANLTLNGDRRNDGSLGGTINGASGSDGRTDTC